jgi:acyl-CoA synthetase (AMP-forming)/AMP-acid ligase II
VNLLLLLDMAASSRGDAPVIKAGADVLTADELWRSAWGGAQLVHGASALAYVATNGLGYPIGVFAAAAAGVPFVPLNYRLDHDQLHELLAPLGTTLVVAEGAARTALVERGHRVLDVDEFVAGARAGTEVGEVPGDGEAPALLLYTSGTTAAPKAAVLRHRHLTSYVIGTVEFAGCDPDDAVLVSVPPYHVAGLANLVTNLYAGRRIVYLTQFDAQEWVETVTSERVTNAMVVPTMLARICDVLDDDPVDLPSLKAISYGGARMPSTVLQRAMERFGPVDFTNAYGLTETSSTIAVLGPEDHRAARGGDSEAIARLSSAGKLLPTIEAEVRGTDGPVATGEPGEIWVRGEQVSGEYAGGSDPRDADGWFPTRDRGWIDPEGYLFIEGRSDDTIIRGGENIAPAEIEEVLLQHPGIAECAVVGLPDDEWGQRIAAVVVTRPGGDLDAPGVQAFARRSLRTSKTPDVVEFVQALPYTETGKLLRRAVLADLLSRS